MTFTCNEGIQMQITIYLAPKEFLFLDNQLLYYNQR